MEHLEDFPNGDIDKVVCQTCATAPAPKEGESAVEPAIRVQEGYYHCPKCLEKGKEPENYHDHCA
jgi:hypothetical protein